MPVPDAGAWQAGARMGQGLAGFMLGGNPDDPGSSPSLGQRIKSGMLSSSEGFDKFIDQQNQLNAAGKSADYLRKAMGDDAEQQMGITDEEWQNMGSREKAAAAQALVQKQVQAKSLADAQEAQARAQYFKERGADYDAQAAQRTGDAAADQKFAQLFLRSTQPQMQPGGVMGNGSVVATGLLGMQPPQTLNPGPKDILSMMLQSGVRPEVALSRANGFAGGRAGAENFFDAAPDKMAQDVPGFPGLKRIITGPKTSILRDENGNVATPMTDEDGNPIGYSVPSGNGTMKFVSKASTEKGQVTDVDKFKQTAQMHAARVKAAAGAMQLASPTDPDYQTKLGAYNKAMQDQEDFLGGSSAAAGESKVATPDIARQYLQQAGGDKAKARAAAKKDGYSF